MKFSHQFLGLFLPMLMVLIVAGLFIHEQKKKSAFARIITEEKQQLLLKQEFVLHTLVPLIAETNDQAGEKKLMQAIQAYDKSPDKEFFILNATGHPLQGPPHPYFPAIWKNSKINNEGYVQKDGALFVYRRLTVSPGNHRILVTHISSGQLWSTLNRHIYWLIGITTLLIVMVALISFLITRSLFKTLQYQEEQRAINKKLLNFEAELNKKTEAIARINQELEQIAYISSQDIQSSIISLRGLLILLIRKEAIKEQYNSMLEMAKNTSEHIQMMVDRLIDVIALKGSILLPRQKIGLHDMLEEVKNTLTVPIKTSGAIIDADFSRCRYVNYPPIHLKSVLQHLITNAIQFKQTDSVPVIDLTSSCDNKNVILCVQDNGIGIDLNSYNHKLFGLFQQFHKPVPGHGVGLYIVHSIVESYGGNISVESKLNKGTTFKIDLGDAKI